MPNVIQLTKKLISIPSYVDKSVNESSIGDFLYSYLKSNTKWLKVSKQPIGNGRYNVVATDGTKPRLVFISHMDTVRPSGDTENMLKPQIRNDCLYGLGAADMKSGLAASVLAAQYVGPTKGVSLIFDCDEEYYFRGIQKIMRTCNFQPELVICPEPTDLKIVNGCRGVIEIKFRVIGKTAHAGTPANGINAVEKTVDIVNTLKEELSQEDSQALGKTTVNLGQLAGGLLQNGSIGVQANAVANAADVLLDIRPANTKLRAADALEVIMRIAKDYNVKITKKEVRLDYSGYITQRNELTMFETAVRKSKLCTEYRDNLGEGGFYKSSFAANNWKCPAINFGPSGKGHIPDENVQIDSMMKTYSIFKNVISKYKIPQ